MPTPGQAAAMSGPLPCPTPGVGLLPTPVLPYGGPGGPPAQNDALRGKPEGPPAPSVASGMIVTAANVMAGGPARAAEGPAAMSGQRQWPSPAAASTPRQPKRPRPAPQAASTAPGVSSSSSAVARGNGAGAATNGRESPVMKRRRYTASWAAGPPLAAEPQEAKASFADLGGVDEVLEEVCRLLAHLRRPEAFRVLGVAPPRGLLLHGPPGCGKSLLARAVAGELGLPLLRVAGPELVAGVSGESEARIRELFEMATNTAPCVLLLDEVDALAPPRVGAQREMERRIVAQLLSCMDELGQTPAGGEVLVLGATSRPEALDAALRRAGRFDREVSLGIPDARAREAILCVLTRSVRLDSNVDLRVLAKRTPGFVGADLQALTREAALAAVTRILHEEERKKLEAIEVSKEKEREKVKEKEKEKMEEREKVKEKEKMEEREKVKEKDELMVKMSESEVKSNVCEIIMGEKVDLKDSASSEEKGVSNPSEKDDAAKSKEKDELDQSKPKDEKEDENMEVIDISDRDTPQEAGVSQNVPSITKAAAATTDEDEVRIEAEVSCSDSVKDKGTSKIIPPSYGNEDEEMEVLEADDEEVVPICETTTLNSTIQQKSGVWSSQFPALSEEQLQNLNITQEDFEAALKHVQPSAKREGFATVPDISWDDVGALRDVREELQMAILAPVRHPEAFESLGLTAPTGLLLCGPPGCGKTLIAKAIANEADINFISVKGPELLNMYVGESEKAVRQCFLRARNSAPCVIFFDELDALCPRRTGGPAGEGSSATQRVVNQLLTEMDGIEGRRGVFLLAASNRPDILDPAVLRPGRLDRVVFVGLPKADARADILRALTKNGTRPKLSSDVDLQVLGESSVLDGCSGADLAALVREAATLALREHLAVLTDGQSEPKEEQPAPCVQTKHLELAMKRLRPSVSPQERLRYDVLRRQFSIPGQEIGPLPSLTDPVSPASGEAQIGSTGPSSVDIESKQQSPSSSVPIVPIAPISVPTA